MNKKTKTTYLTISFIALQYITAVLLMAFFTAKFGFAVEFLKNVLFYILIFFVPIWIFIKKILYENPFLYLHLNYNPKALGIGFLIAIIMSAIFLITNQFTIRIPAFDLPSILTLAGTALAGLFEEIVFRGFYLKFFESRFSFVWANLITSFLFSLLHVPYIIQQNFIQLIMLFIISLFLGYVYKKFKSIWVPVILHIAFNLLIILFR